MRYFLSFIIIMSSIFSGCQNSTPSEQETKTATTAAQEMTKEDHFKKVEEIATQLKSKPTNLPLDKPLAQQLIDESKAYADANRYDKENNPAFLFRAGEVARAIHQYEEAISLFGQVAENYPEHAKAPVALFLQATVYQDDLQDKEKAKTVYQSVIEKYPSDPWAEQARQLLLVIDKSPEELVKEFQKKNKK